MPITAVWATPRKNLALPEDEIHVWRVSLRALERAVLERLETTLSPEEKSRADRFHFSRDRDCFVGSHGILRELLGNYLQRPATELEFCYGPQDKPELRTNDRVSPIHFNLSHSQGLAVYAFSRGREVGIDVEMIRPDFAGEEIAERYFSGIELAELRALPSELRAEGFFLCWTRKEAYVKARGAGLQIPLGSFNVSLTPGQPEKLESSDSSRWSLYSLQPAPRYVGAVVGEGKNWHLLNWEWSP
jgi:4'-phosphopantetheinyl transferase